MDFITLKESLTLSELQKVHSSNSNVAPTLSRFNRTTDNLNGKSVASITVAQPAIAKFFNDNGYQLTVAPNQIGQPTEHYLPFGDDDKQQLFVDKVADVLYHVAKRQFPNLTGSITYFDEALPVVHVFENSTSNDPLTHNPSHTKHDQQKDKSSSNSNSGKKQSGNQQQEQLTQQHLRQAIAQQQAAEKEEEKKRKERQKRERERRQRRRHEPDLEP